MAKKNRQARDARAAAPEEAEQSENLELESQEEEVVPAEKVVAPIPVVQPPAPKKEVALKVDFDAWFAMRGSKIPKHHHKEVIKADFKGRGLGQYESLEDFDKALKQYGINLA